MAEIINFTAGVSEIVALKFDTGKNCDGKHGPRVQYSTVDDRIFFLDPQPAGDIERELGELGITAGTEFKLTKVRTSHGGHRWAVDRVAPRRDAGGHNMPERQTRSAPSNDAYDARYTDPAPSSRAEWDQHTKAAAAVSATPAARNTSPTNGSTQSNITPASACMCAAMMAAVDAVIETQAYAARKGLGLTFSEESVRAVGLSIYISSCKGGR